VRGNNVKRFKDFYLKVKARMWGPKICRSPHPDLQMIGKSHQERARVITASGDGHGRPPRPEIDGREVRPHLCTQRIRARVRTCACVGSVCNGWVESCSWAITVGTVAPVGSVAVTELPIPIPAPALDGRIVLQRGVSESMVDGSRNGRVAFGVGSSFPIQFPNLQVPASRFPTDRAISPGARTCEHDKR